MSFSEKKEKTETKQPPPKHCCNQVSLENAAQNSLLLEIHNITFGIREI